MSKTDGNTSGRAYAPTQRNELRTRLRKERDQLDAETVASHSSVINRLALPLLAKANHVAAYFALGREVDMTDLLSHSRERGQTTYVPLVLSGHRMLFAPVDDNTPLVSNRYGIREPQVDESQCLEPGQLDAVLVPLVGFDSDCNRLGMGGGYYDRSFAHRRAPVDQQTDRPLLIGVAFDQQRVDSVFPDWWDVPLDHVVTESGIINRR